jgi:TonB family protein
MQITTYGLLALLLVICAGMPAYAQGKEPAKDGAGSVPAADAPSLDLSLRLLSDPQGVDFKPYLTRISETVRRYWLAIIPASARQSTGKALLQIPVDKHGKVAKIVIAAPSGTDALDRSAVAAISASIPFPPLPTEFQGNEVRVQFAFAYNMK